MTQRFSRFFRAIASIFAFSASFANAEEISNQTHADFSLDSFYTHCTIADGMPVIGSSQVAPEALAEAAHIIEQMLKDRREVLTALANKRGHVCHDDW